MRSLAKGGIVVGKVTAYDVRVEAILADYEEEIRAAKERARRRLKELGLPPAQEPSPAAAEPARVPTVLAG